MTWNIFQYQYKGTLHIYSLRVLEWQNIMAMAIDACCVGHLCVDPSILVSKHAFLVSKRALVYWTISLLNDIMIYISKKVFLYLYPCIFIYIYIHIYICIYIYICYSLGLDRDTLDIPQVRFNFHRPLQAPCQLTRRPRSYLSWNGLPYLKLSPY